MKVKGIIWVLVIVALIFGVGLYVADMVKKNPGTMECVLGVGPSKNPTLCYGWRQSDGPSILI